LGLNKNWQAQVVAELTDHGFELENLLHNRFDLLRCNPHVILNLIPLINDYSPEELLEIQAQCQITGVYLLQLWEDVWNTRKDQVLGRIKSVSGLNRRMHARKGLVVKLNQKQADDFLVLNHIQASAKSKYKFGLVINEELVAVACFSGVRPMKHIGPEYKSIELIRFASSIGITVTGGFSKLLKHLIRLMQPDDIMSYADRDWSLGQAYDQGGFKLTDIIPPAEIWISTTHLTRYFTHRRPVATETDSTYLKIFNTGNLKYILYL
jgi:hypothetical protein